MVDTRSSNVNIDKYNEKYDQLADQKVKTRTDNVVTKQKFPNRNSQRRGQQRRGKRETEAERLNGIARERPPSSTPSRCPTKSPWASSPCG